MIASGNHLGQIRPSLATTPGLSTYSSHTSVSPSQKEEFEKSLDEPQSTKSGWGTANEKQFALSLFQFTHNQSINHDTKMKEIYESMNEPSKSNGHHRKG